MKLDLRVIGVTQCGDCNAPAGHSVYKEDNGSEKAGMFSYYLDLMILRMAQSAALAPARQAARMSPMEATRAALG